MSAWTLKPKVHVVCVCVQAQSAFRVLLVCDEVASRDDDCLYASEFTVSRLGFHSMMTASFKGSRYGVEGRGFDRMMTAFCKGLG